MADLDTTPQGLLKLACTVLRVEDVDAVFRKLCQMQGLSALTTEVRLNEFAENPGTLPHVVHEAILEHVIGVSTS